MMAQKKFYYLYNKNSPLNGNRHIGPIDAKLFLRDLSLPVAYVLARHKVNANTVTFFFFVMSIIANLIFIIPSPSTFILLVMLYETAQLFDCVDGQLARYHGTFSKFGELFDDFAHTLIGMSFMMAFGIRLYFETGRVFFLLIGAVGMGSRAFDILEEQTVNELKDNAYSEKLKSLVRNIHFLYTFDEVRFFTMVALCVYLFQIMIVKSLPLTSTLFTAYALFAFTDRVLYKVFLVMKQSAKTERRVWKGWPSQ